MEKKLRLVSALARWCCLGTRVMCTSVVYSQLSQGSGTEQGEYCCIPKCCQQQFCCRLLGLSCTSTVYPTSQFYASLEKQFKGKHLCHHNEVKAKVHWWVQTLSLVSYPWKLNVGECLNNQEIWEGWGMWHVWETREVHTGFWWGDLSERDHLEDLGIDGDSIKMDLVKWYGNAGTGLIWLRTGTGDGHLWMH
jgi:hypothetical protein